MATFTLSAAINKFLKKLTLTGGEQIELRTLINAADHTATTEALALKQPLDTDLTEYAGAAGAAARRALIGAAPLISPTFSGAPTSSTPAVGDRSAQLATTEFVWGNGPLKVIQPNSNLNGSLQAQYYGDDSVAPNTLGQGACDLQVYRSQATYVASGYHSFIAGGRDNTASGQESFATGAFNTSSGIGSFAEGHDTVASGDHSHAGGLYTVAGAHGQVAYGTASANSQVSRFDLYKQTTDPTIGTMRLGNAGEIPVREGWVMAGTANIIGVKTTDGTVAAHYIRKFAIKNVSGTVSMMGSVSAVGTDYESNAGSDVTIYALSNPGSLRIDVTPGVADTTIRWAACVDVVEVKMI